MPASAATRDAQAVGVHSIRDGVVPDEPNGSLHVRHDLRDRELRLRAVHDSKNRVAAVEQGPAEIRIDGLMRREPSATDNENNTHPIGLTWLEHIERERGAELAPVEHILTAGETDIGLGPGAGQG
jgi:hypothetical protein